MLSDEQLATVEGGTHLTTGLAQLNFALALAQGQGDPLLVALTTNIGNLGRASLRPDL